MKGFGLGVANCTKTRLTHAAYLTPKAESLAIRARRVPFTWGIYFLLPGEQRRCLSFTSYFLGNFNSK